jgi:hypothetical protein
LNKSRYECRLFFHENPDEVFGFRLVHIGPLLKLVGALGLRKSPPPRLPWIAEGIPRPLPPHPEPQLRLGRLRANADWLACGIRRFDGSLEISWETAPF